MRTEWEIVHESDTEETGEPSCWAKEVNSKRYGRFIWITKVLEGYNVECRNDNGFTILKNCKSLTSAKRWVSINI